MNLLLLTLVVLVASVPYLRADDFDNDKEDNDEGDLDDDTTEKLYEQVSNYAECKTINWHYYFYYTKGLVKVVKHGCQKDKADFKLELRQYKCDTIRSTVSSYCSSYYSWNLLVTAVCRFVNQFSSLCDKPSNPCDENEVIKLSLGKLSCANYEDCGKYYYPRCRRFWSCRVKRRLCERRNKKLPDCCAQTTDAPTPPPTDPPTPPPTDSPTPPPTDPPTPPPTDPPTPPPTDPPTPPPTDPPTPPPTDPPTPPPTDPPTPPPTDPPTPSLPETIPGNFDNACGAVCVRSDLLLSLCSTTPDGLCSLSGDQAGQYSCCQR